LPQHILLRAVFDATATRTNVQSLDDKLLIGPTFQQSLFSIMVRFRTHEIASTADIEGINRQIRVHSMNTKLQRILWRASSDTPIQTYELQTVTYGTESAPYLATASLKKLAEEEMATTVLSQDFCMDDVLSGCHNVTQTLKLQPDLMALLASAGFPLRKCCSNHPRILEAIRTSTRDIVLPRQLHGKDKVNILGLCWHPTLDKFAIANSKKSVALTEDASKLKVAAVVTSIFYPLQTNSPSGILYKIFF